MLIDIHAHTGRIGPRSNTITAEDVIRNMDRYGIERSCVLPLADCPEGDYLANTTEDVIAACARYPDRLVPFCLIHPRFGKNAPDADFSELLAEYRARGCVGLGELVSNHWIDDPHAMNLYRQAGEAGLPVLFDMTSRVGTHYGVVDEPGLPRLERVLGELPGTTFIGHGPTFWAEISPNSASEDRGGYPSEPFTGDGAVGRLMDACPNLWADTSARSGYNALTRVPEYGLEFLERFCDKMLFGTDNCLVVATDQSMAIAALLCRARKEGKLPEEAYRKITEGNAAGLLGV